MLNTRDNAVNLNLGGGERGVFRHPGGKAPWVCPFCEKILNAPGLFTKHLTKMHSIRTEDMHFVCSRCDNFSNSIPNPVGNHMRYCKGPKPEDSAESVPCENCDMRFTTISGKQVHRSRIHKVEYNEELPTKKVFAWTDNEIIELARQTARLKQLGTTGSDADKVISQDFLPSRTAEAMRKIRSKDRYRRLDAERVVRNADQEDVVVRLDQSDIEDPILIGEERAGGLAQAREVLSTRIEEWDRGELTEQEALVLRYAKGILEWEEVKQILFPVEPKANRGRAGGEKDAEVAGPQRDNRKTRKKEKFRATQKQFKTKRKETIQKIINNEFEINPDMSDGPKLEDIERVFRERLETVRVDSTPEVINDQRLENPELFGFITPIEVEESIKTFKLDTASSIDGVKLAMVLTISSKVLSLILNVWRVRGIPLLEKANLSILLYKADDKADVNNYRPLTIGSILMRLYAKIWDKRLRAVVQLNDRQKAFVPVDGCFQNVNIIRTVIKRSRKAGIEVNVVFLDLAKAFDTVTHDSIRKAMARKGLPREVIEHIMDFYNGAKTQFSTNEGRTGDIEILSGVKQGCPLSPLLFNLVLDELLERIEKLNCGVKLDDMRIGAMAFADDLAIMAGSGGEMDILLNACREFFNEKSLTINAKKCASLRVLPVKGKKSMKVVTIVHRKWGGENIPSLTFNDLGKYLGVKLSPLGDVVLPFEQWRDWFTNLKRSALKVEQKLEVIRSSICAMIFYVLRVSNARITHLRKVDVLLRRWYRVLTHVPVWCPNAWIHHVGGGAMPCLTELVVKSRMKAVTKMLTAVDDVAMKVGMEIEGRCTEDLRKLDFHDRLSAFKKAMNDRRVESLKKVPNGTALVTMVKSYVQRRWLWYGGNLKTGSKIQCLKILSGTLPTRLNETRGINDAGLKLCRRCRKAAETDLHIMCECEKNQGMIIKRHDYIKDKIVKEIKNSRPGDLVQSERTWQVGQRRYRPDITIFSGNNITFVDVTIAYEKDGSTLERREIEKEVKYSDLNATSLPLEGIEHYHYLGLAFGAAGTIDSRTVNKLKSIGYPTRIVHHLQITVMSGSSMICTSHFRNK